MTKTMAQRQCRSEVGPVVFRIGLSSTEMPVYGNDLRVHRPTVIIYDIDLFITDPSPNVVLKTKTNDYKRYDN